MKIKLNLKYSLKINLIYNFKFYMHNELGNWFLNISFEHKIFQNTFEKAAKPNFDSKSGKNQILSLLDMKIPLPPKIKMTTKYSGNILILIIWMNLCMIIFVLFF